MEKQTNTMAVAAKATEGSIVRARQYAWRAVERRTVSARATES
jgi:hypothetical protein